MDDLLMCRKAPDQQRDILSRVLTVRAESLDEETRSVEAVLSTERVATVFDFQRREIIDEVLRADGAQFGSQVVLLENHNRFEMDAVIGSVRNILRDGNRIIGRLMFAEGDERAERAFQKVRQGHITDVSVGYKVAADSPVIPAGTSRAIQGKRYTAGNRPLRIATSWTIREGSLVPIGADEDAKIRAQMEVCAMNEQLRRYLESIGLERGASTEDAWTYMRGLEGEQLQRAEALREDSDMPPQPAQPAQPATGQRSEPAESSTQRQAADPPANPSESVDPDQIRADAQRAERERISALREMAGDDVDGELVERAINEGWSAERAAPQFLRSVRDRSPAVATSPAVHSRNHERDCTRQALEAAVGLMIGRQTIDPNATDETRREQERITDLGSRYSSMSALDLCREAIRLDGASAPHDRGEMIRAAVSGSSLNHIFTTNINVLLLQSYTEAGDSTAGWVRERDVNNFQSQERKQMGKTGGLRRLPRGGTAQHTQIDDKGEEYKIARYAEQFVIDDQDIIDDNLGVLMDMPREMGMASARLRPDLIYSILLANPTLAADGLAVFQTAKHKNLVTTGSALSADSLQAGITAMAKQVVEAGNGDKVKLNVRPKFLIIPHDLYFPASILLRSAERVIAADSGGTFNPLRNMLDIRTDDRIGLGGVVDPVDEEFRQGTATNWFLAADPNAIPTIEVGYLRGSGRGPTVRSFVLDRGQYGIGWDIKMDIGAKALDFRGLYKATGAA